MRCTPCPSPGSGRLPLRQAADLPGPRGLPLLGNLLQIEPAQMHRQLEDWCAVYGSIYQIRLGRRRMVVVGDHRVTAAALRDRPEGWRRTSRMEATWLEMGFQAGVFGANDEAWRRQRRMVMAGFDPARIKRYYPGLQQVGQRLAARWRRAAALGAAIDLQADLMRYTVDAIAGLAFGAEVNTLESDGDIIQQHLDQIFPALFRRILAPLPLWRYVRLPADRALARNVAAVNAAVDGFIVQARQRMQAEPQRRQQPGNLLESMIAAADEEGSGIDDAQIAGNVLTMLLAGEDTTANTLAWMIELLWLHPAVLARAASEVRGVLGGGGARDARVAPTLVQLAQLDYVEACAHEAMRLKPVAPIIGLEAARDNVVGDVEVAAGTVVINLMRRDSVSDSHLPRAAAFEPERWLEGGGAAGAHTAVRRVSLPFGAGPRICPGRYLALLEIKLAIAVLLGGFEIEIVASSDGRPAAERLSFTMMPVGLRMRLREIAAEAPTASAAA